MESTHPATVRVPGRLRDALTLSALRELDGEPLIEFLRRQRWFGSKGLADATARFRNVMPLFSEPTIDAAIARVEITVGQASIATYQLTLAVRRGEAIDPGALAVVESGAGRGILIDAVRDADFRARLLRALRDRERFEVEGRRWIATPYGESLPDPVTPSRLLEGEQSNSSIVYGQSAMVKIYRRLTAGPNPEAEIAEFLAAHAFAHIPALLGLFRIVDTDGSETVAGIAQQFVVAGDGWSYARRRTRDLVISSHERTAGRAAFLDDCRRLGEITGALHRALCSDASNPDFSPYPVGADDLAHWREGLRGQVDTSVALLDASLRSGTLGSDGKSVARVVLTEARALLDRATAFLSALGPGAGAQIRHHGDYHLGQVLRKTDGDFVILDFEGEPARPLAERRQRHSPLRDVAGMLRSFAYAAAVTVKEDIPTKADARQFRAQADALATEMQRAFRTGYFRAAPPTPILPASSDVTEGLLTIFEIEKAFYELAYELNNRPSWADIPLTGIREILSRALPDPRRLPQ